MRKSVYKTAKAIRDTADKHQGVAFVCMMLCPGLIMLYMGAWSTCNWLGGNRV